MDTTRMKRGGGSRMVAAVLAAAVTVTGCATAQPPASPDEVPDYKPPTAASFDGWCYTVEAEDWSPSLVERFPELDGFTMPTVVYLGTEQHHRDLPGHVDNGRENLPWSGAREARWVGETPFDNEPWAFDHAHWWRLDDGSYRVGFAGSYLFWVGFEAVPTENGLEGIFRYWGLDALGEAVEPEVEMSASLGVVDCRDTPLVVIQD